MKRRIRWLSVLGVILVSCLGLLLCGWVQPVGAVTLGSPSVGLVAEAMNLSDVADDSVCPDFEQKIDLNNANIVAFTDCRGFYPTLASLIVQHAPYETVEDVLTIPGLSDRQKTLLKSQLKNFMVTEPTVPLEMRMPPRTAR